MYHINHGTGAGDSTAETLDQARAIAERDASYTQVAITITDDDGNVVARLPWWGIAASEDDEPVVDYGSFGFFGPWEGPWEDC